jgi:hypothetical protein
MRVASVYVIAQLAALDKLRGNLARLHGELVRLERHERAFAHMTIIVRRAY